MSGNQQEMRERLAIVEHRQNEFERAVEDIRDAIVGLRANLEIIARIDERQAGMNDAIARAFKRMDRHAERLKALESVVPMNSLARVAGGKLVIGLIMVGCSLIGGAIARLLVP